MPFIPIPLPEKVPQTSSYTIWLHNFVLQTGLGMGMGINGTAQQGLPGPRDGLLDVARGARRGTKRGQTDRWIDRYIDISIYVCIYIYIYIYIDK